jgi:hypothetical protein
MVKKEVLLMQTIYVSITSLDDSELIPTVLGAFDNASIPERVFVGVHLWGSVELKNEFSEKLAKYSDNIRFKFNEMSEEGFSELSGVGKGRRRALNLYKNEDYLLQIDSHSLFAKRWDETLIKTLEEAKVFVKNKKTIITGYAGFYRFSALGKRIWSQPNDSFSGFDGRFQYPYYVSNERYYDFIPAWTVFTQKEIEKFPGNFMPATKFNANFAFGDSAWAADTGLYDDAEFFEEEVLQTINLMKLGYTLVFPKTKDPVIGHLYTDLISGDYGKRVNLSKLAGYSNEKGSKQAIKNYKEYISSPENLEVVKQYCKYVRIHMSFGPLDKNPYVPKYFLNSEVTYEY